MNFFQTMTPAARDMNVRKLKAMEMQLQNNNNSIYMEKAHDGKARRAFRLKQDGWSSSIFRVETKEEEPEVKQVKITIPPLPKIPCELPQLTPITLPHDSKLERFENETRNMSDTIVELESKLEELESKMTILGEAVVSIKQYSELNAGMGKMSVDQLQQMHNLNDSESEVERVIRFLKNLFNL